jgi:putative DNA primase/helicase
MSLYPNDDAYAQAKKLVRALEGQWHGGHGMACCPAHDDTNPSLSVTQKNGRVLFYCHAGCSQREVMNALSSLELRIGLPRVSREAHPSCEDELKQQHALEIWAASKQAAGTPVETYLYSGRGIEIPIPETLRFHPGLKHRSGGVYPAMVGLCGIHRTFLIPDGTAKAPVTPQKMALGQWKGGAIRLAPATDLVMVAEGIETALSVMQAKKWPAWAALSASGFRTLDLPAEIKRVIVLADGDDSGEVAAKRAVYRWHREGRQVSIARPPYGLDFNDILCGRFPA